jgi:OOP family OmpA-OmpF porin
MHLKHVVAMASILALPLAIAACSQDGHYGSVYELDALHAAPPSGTSFTQYLSKDYLVLADTNKAEYNWPVMALWARKSKVANEGTAVAPEVVTDWSYASLQLGGVNGTFFTPDSAAAPALEEARGRLMAMLGSDAPTRFPEWAATAQTKFDCWLEATHEALSPTEKEAECKKGFDDAMAAIYAKPKMAEAPAPAPTDAPAKTPSNYLVFFDFDKYNLSPEARKIIATAAQAIKAGGAIKIDVTGFTDTVGTVDYNIKLSYRRADAVEQELVRDGVPAGNIAVSGKGKTDLLVPTADGVREPKNRRAVIEFPGQ